MTTFIVIIHVVVCLVLILVILLQAGRGSGLSWGSFGGSPQSFLGTKSASFLAKATSVCAIIFLLTCILLNVLEVQKSKSLYGAKSSNASQMDLEKIKQALEKIKTNGENAAGDATKKAENEVQNESAPLENNQNPPPATP